MRVLVVSLALPLIAAAQLGSVCSADGYVVNSLTGEPVPRASLQFTGAAPATTASDSVGRWKISGIPCGAMMVSASKTGYLNPGPGRFLRATTTPDSPAHD